MYGEDVDDFNPARFLKDGVKDPDVAFGFGRRVCPGRWMADSQLFIMIATILQAFKIEPHESEIPTKDDFVPGVIS
ncbi:hypothetical protein Clacol_000047 [Clathrus columnatus]|uniref:Cytochrome P450 n=1 Tax=Clathrus columnatus TaxID=1419009 RepID=A0AAV5A1U4_9AGAM|nr:hypothetical protein Clacol_000047 [Clathrus columnatus]